jgi:heptosyltransferase-3
MKESLKGKSVMLKKSNAFRDFEGNILLVQLGDIGDVVLTFPAIQALKENYPDKKLIVCVREKAKELVEDCAWPDGVMAVTGQRENKAGYILDQIKFFRKLRSYGFGLAVDLRTGTRGAILTFLSSAPRRIGRFADDGKLWRNRLFTDLVNPADELKQYSAEHNLNILDPLNLKIQNRIPEISVPVKRRYETGALFEKEGITKDRPVFVIHPFSLWKYKEWPIEQWILLVDYVVETFGCDIVITGSEADRVRAGEIQARTKGGIYNLAGKTPIGLLPAVMQACQLFIGVDTAALHIAAAVGTPTIAIFGPSSPVCWAPRGDNHYLVVNNMPCVPCRNKGCQNSGISRCLDTLRFAEVVDRIEKHLSRHPLFGLDK